MVTNVNRPWGFRPVGNMDASKWNGMSNMYAFSTSETHDTFVGDLVQFDSTNRATSLTDVFIPGSPLAKPVITGATTTAVRGVIAGFIPQPEFNMLSTASLGLRYRVASTARYALVVDDPATVFDAQEDGNSWTSASNNAIGKVTDIAYTAGSTLTGISGAQISSSGVTTGSVRPFKVIRLTQRVDNFGFSAVATDTLSYAHYDVFIINSDYAQANTGA